ncbi:MAG: hypothetical protein ACQ9MH_11625 [Nitrospinales bacterium]
MNEKSKLPEESLNQPEKIPTVSMVFDDGSILETVYQPKEKTTAFVLWKDGKWSFEKKFPLGKRYYLVPYSPHNNLIKNEVILFPSTPEEYGSEKELVDEIQRFIHRYVQVSPLYEKIATYYVLFSWVYDQFNELPYLRLRGAFGSGKTRFLLCVGALAYKSIFASGASTVSPIFHILNAFKGTLIIDEGDFRFSDEKAEMVKILNNGNVKGFPVLRTEFTGNKEYNPKAFQVFGPKIVATRGYYQDQALESRFITEEMGQEKLRDDIPINLPSEYKEEALIIRNKLLLFRLKNFGNKKAIEGFVDRSIEPRLNQIFVPLISIIDDPEVRDQIKEIARGYNKEMLIDRGMDIEAQILEVIKSLSSKTEKNPISIKGITTLFIERFVLEYDRKITNKWIGYIVRKKLKLKTQKSNGIFVISPTEKAKLEILFEKYGMKGDDKKTEKKAP